MTNVEKAKELASSERISFDELNESYCNGIEYGAIEMAEWKDKEFEKQKKAILDKACQWIESREGWDYCDVPTKIFNEEDIEEFRKFMEE